VNAAEAAASPAPSAAAVVSCWKASYSAETARRWRSFRPSCPSLALLVVLLRFEGAFDAAVAGFFKLGVEAPSGCPLRLWDDCLSGIVLRL